MYNARKGSHSVLVKYETAAKETDNDVIKMESKKEKFESVNRCLNKYSNRHAFLPTKYAVVVLFFSAV